MPKQTNKPIFCFILLSDGAMINRVLCGNGLKQKSLYIPSSIAGNEIKTVQISDTVQIAETESIYIASGIRKIDSFCFQGCSCLKSVQIPDTVLFINESAFSSCPNLKTVSIPEDCFVHEKAFDENCIIYRRKVARDSSDCNKHTIKLKRRKERTSMPPGSYKTARNRGVKLWS